MDWTKEGFLGGGQSANCLLVGIKEPVHKHWLRGGWKRDSAYHAGVSLPALMLPTKSSAAADEPAAPPGIILPCWHPLLLARSDRPCTLALCGVTGAWQIVYR